MHETTLSHTRSSFQSLYLSQKAHLSPAFIFLTILNLFLPLILIKEILAIKFLVLFLALLAGLKIEAGFFVSKRWCSFGGCAVFWKAVRPSSKPKSTCSEPAHTKMNQSTDGLGWTRIAALLASC